MAPVVPADVHQSDGVAFSAARSRKCARKTAAIELLVFLLAGALSPTSRRVTISDGSPPNHPNTGELCSVLAQASSP
jgi:hypothetical protein